MSNVLIDQRYLCVLITMKNNNIFEHLLQIHRFPLMLAKLMRNGFDDGKHKYSTLHKNLPQQCSYQNLKRGIKQNMDIDMKKQYTVFLHPVFIKPHLCDIAFLIKIFAIKQVQPKGPKKKENNNQKQTLFFFTKMVEDWFPNFACVYRIQVRHLVKPHGKKKLKLLQKWQLKMAPKKCSCILLVFFTCI